MPPPPDSADRLPTCFDSLSYSTNHTSSDASSRGGLSLRINTAKASPKIEEVIPAAAASATSDDERPAKISFSGDRSNHPRSISGTRKRSKQLIYAAADQNGDGAEAHGPARPGSAIQYLNC
ncbi:hypothetical protein PtB15_1B135 [Puccinia triticina]|nr:hypothetical protein PtB15_1B135 [Puccinia triticina]